MSLIARFSAPVASAVFGLLMVCSAGAGPHGPGLATGAAAVAAVGVGIVVRPAATVAVLLSVVTILLCHPPLGLVAVSGLCATGYLVCRYAASAASWTTVVGALGFSFVGLVATSFPLQLPWLPLAAPLAALAIYLLATRPFWG